mgnify:FL=1
MMCFMPKHLEVLFSPAEFEALSQRDLSQTACVVFDILRATSSMVVALAHGARAILPVSEIGEALAIKAQQPDLLLAGERHGLRIGADQTGGIEFDLGNSPREFTIEKVSGRVLAMTTTNGTRALRACAGAKRVWVASFANLSTTARALFLEPVEKIILVCSGTYEEAAYEDTLVAGALVDWIWHEFSPSQVADSACIARTIYHAANGDPEAILQSRNARRLFSIPDLREDVPHCLRRDIFKFAAAMKCGKVERVDVP